MSAQSLLHSVFSCSSPASGSTASAKGFSKKKLRQTRSLDPALIGGCSSEMGTEGGLRGSTVSRLHSPQQLAEGLGSRSASSPRSQHLRATRFPTPRPLCSSFSTPSTPQEKSPSGSFHFDYEVPLSRSGLKKSMAWDLPSVLAGSASGRSPASILWSSGGGPNGIFASPRRWLQQRKFQPQPNSRSHPYVVWRSEEDTSRFHHISGVKKPQCYVTLLDAFKGLEITKSPKLPKCVQNQERKSNSLAVLEFILQTKMALNSEFHLPLNPKC
ncbi:hypothetical protein STEG23_020992 [Scotinomys teguina]